jgi:hypothetical protein
MAAMLDDVAKQANKKSIASIIQHGGDDVTCKSRNQEI